MTFSGPILVPTGMAIWHLKYWWGLARVQVYNLASQFHWKKETAQFFLSARFHSWIEWGINQQAAAFPKDNGAGTMNCNNEIIWKIWPKKVIAMLIPYDKHFWSFREVVNYCIEADSPTVCAEWLRLGEIWDRDPWIEVCGRSWLSFGAS